MVAKTAVPGISFKEYRNEIVILLPNDIHMLVMAMR
jgi:hypothetical protein